MADASEITPEVPQAEEPQEVKAAAAPQEETAAPAAAPEERPEVEVDVPVAVPVAAEVATEDQPDVPAPEVVAEAPAAEPVPTMAATITVPALETPSTPVEPDGEGGEWELLVSKLRHWLASGELEQQWQRARTPLSLTAGLIAVLLVLRLYSALLGVIDSLPLVPGLLELAGVVAVVQFGLSKLLRSRDRQQLISGVKNRWKAFRGQG